ncbi:MAG: hypothetical protein QGH69_05215 [Alphaproteobacteria bacterium]|jgi:prophage tail gpP-like protein|nr:hypothetical protein [Alphaproteobacteria bacterium]
MLKSYDFKVRIDGTVYTHTSSMRFNRSMDMLGGGLKLDLIDPDRSLIRAFRPGIRSEIEINGVTITKAIFDLVSINDNNGHVYSYTGRDPSGDLVDCSAMFSDGGFSKKNINLETAIKDLLKPYGMGVKMAADGGAAFNEVSFTPGETVAEVIRRLCKYRALFPFSDGFGNLVITKAGARRSGGYLATGDEGNVITRNGDISHIQRYSEIIVKGGSNGGAGLEGFSEASPDDLASKEGRARDPDITRHRPLIIQAESEGYDLDLQERALWEVRHRRFSGVSLNYTVPGWEAAEGEFWKINTLVPVIDAPLFIKRDMLVKSVELSRDDQGTTTTLGVAPAEAYDLPPSREPESDDALWGGA